MAVTHRMKPITPGQRFRIAPDFSMLTKKKPEKSLLLPLKKKAGRNNSGKMTVPCRGGGHKQKVRIVDFYRQKHNVVATVKAIEYDPIRSAHLALVYYEDGIKSYILAAKDLKIGDKIVSGDQVSPEIGNAMPLSAMPVGTIVHNIEFNPGAGGACARSAGAYAQLVAREGKNATIKLPSGEMRMVNKACMATVGVVANSEHSTLILGKAGANRRLGRRPKVRGTVMNPCDHPNGGGEGKNKGKQPRSRTGIYAKGQKTRKRNKYSDRMILKKRK